ncbi:MAG TPA: hypothetical protein VEI97_10210 [bacterium]|nr:hypothetical protein [bacterium]
MEVLGFLVMVGLGTAGVIGLVVFSVYLFDPSSDRPPFHWVQAAICGECGWAERLRYGLDLDRDNVCPRCGQQGDWSRGVAKRSFLGVQVRQPRRKEKERA